MSNEQNPHTIEAITAVLLKWRTRRATWLDVMAMSEGPDDRDRYNEAVVAAKQIEFCLNDLEKAMKTQRQQSTEVNIAPIRDGQSSLDAAELVEWANRTYGLDSKEWDDCHCNHCMPVWQMLKHAQGMAEHNEQRIRGLINVAEQLLSVIGDDVVYSPRALGEIRLHLVELRQGKDS